MAATFRILQHITCGFAPGEIRSADEFPAGTNFAGLVERGVMRPTDLSAYPTGEADKIKLMDELEELSQQHAKLKDDSEAQAAASRERIRKAEEERDEFRRNLATSGLELEAKDAELRRLQAALDEARAQGIAAAAGAPAEDKAQAAAATAGDKKPARPLTRIVDDQGKPRADSEDKSEPVKVELHKTGPLAGGVPDKPAETEPAPEAPTPPAPHKPHNKAK